MKIIGSDQFAIDTPGDNKQKSSKKFYTPEKAKEMMWFMAH